MALFLTHTHTHDMLAFDIETTGLNPLECYVTVVCTYDENKESRVYHLCKPCCGGGDENAGGKECSCTPAQVKLGPGEHRCIPCREWHADNLYRLFAALDDAPVLCGYNAIKFDISFLQTRFGVPSERAGAWAAKCVDIFFFVSEVLETYCSLDRVCGMNGVAGKISSGKEAVSMAHEGQWDKLEKYCTMDAIITMDLTMKRSIRVPAFGNSGEVVSIVWVQSESTNEGEDAWHWSVESGKQNSRPSYPSSSSRYQNNNKKPRSSLRLLGGGLGRGGGGSVKSLFD